MSADSCIRVVLRDVALHIPTRARRSVRTDSPVLLFLHYFGGSGGNWASVMDLLARRGFCCLAPDLRGFGKSVATKHADRALSVREWSDDIVNLARFLGLGRFVLVGHSMGGKIALAVAARAPAGLEGVVLLAPSPPTPEPMAAKERARLLDGYGDAAAARQTLREITGRPLSPDRAAGAVKDSIQTSRAAWQAWLKHGSREDISAMLAAIHVPVSIAIGAADKTITESLVQREIADRLRGSVPVQTIPRAGHLLPLEAPKATADFIECAVSRPAAKRQSIMADRRAVIKVSSAAAHFACA